MQETYYTILTKVQSHCPARSYSTKSTNLRRTQRTGSLPLGIFNSSHRDRGSVESAIELKYDRHYASAPVVMLAFLALLVVLRLKPTHYTRPILQSLRLLKWIDLNLPSTVLVRINC